MNDFASRNARDNSPASLSRGRTTIERGWVRLCSVTKLYDRRDAGFNLRLGFPWGEPSAKCPAAAVADVDLVVEKGSSLALIGPNGAGKTTILKLIAGVTVPSSGVVEVGGRVGSLIELGVGFHPDLTGWQNLRCSARLLGLDRRLVHDSEQSIAQFAGLGAAMEAPLRTYSSGMIARLGFAVATSVPCDVLLVDEVLSVGDQAFRDRCIGRIEELQRGGTTLLLVTHQMPLVSGFCERAVHVRGGRVIDDGPAAEVVRGYVGGSPTKYHCVADPPVRWRSFGPETSEVKSPGPLRFSGEIEVGRAVSDVRWTVELNLLAHPEYVFASDSGVLGEIIEPGRYRVHAKGNPFLAQSADVVVRATLLTARATEVMDTTIAHLSFDGPWSEDPRPRVATIPRWRIELVGVQSSAAPPTRTPIAAPHSGPERVQISSLCKAFDVPAGEFGRRTGWRRHKATRVKALTDVSLVVESGTTLGLIGGNGAGKSTLLGIIAGTTSSDTGSVESLGRVIPVLGLGLGLHPDLTGRENLELAASLLGFSRAEYEERREEVEQFTGLRDVLDRPARTYSTGMAARLTLALAFHANPAVLLIDEVLSVGDQDFRSRSLKAIGTLSESGTSTIFVSHELDLVAEVCDRAARISAGVLVDIGETDVVLERYGAKGGSGRSVGVLSGITVGNVDVARQVIPVGGAIELNGSLDVVDASSTAWIELRYVIASSLTETEDGPPRTDNAKSNRLSVLRSVVENPGGVLSRKGRYAFNCTVDENPFRGEVWVDIVVLDYDQNGEEVLVAQSWHRVRVGPPTDLISFPLDLVWTIEPVDRVSSHH